MLCYSSDNLFHRYSVKLRIWTYLTYAIKGNAVIALRKETNLILKEMLLNCVAYDLSDASLIIELAAEVVLWIHACVYVYSSVTSFPENLFMIFSYILCSDRNLDQKKVIQKWILQKNSCFSRNEQQGLKVGPKSSFLESS